ncbi:Mor transcription activator family protein [Desulfobacula phenolica]|uniref:Mor transcription activator family protein n=1 Tax=Desulfobacula phenolica TaxID=90732 RepID=A0A1H2H5L4_9BACT|nr:Mor transcription activator family protein [Desulfobacula phenolica]SDU27114.1 Mor transcription activator family protein [Desulfobacula phenolica]
MSQWDEIEIDDLEGDMIDIAETIGLSAAKKLLTVFGGESIYIPKPESVIRSLRDRKIYQEFKNDNYRQLAARYNLTTRQIRAIIKEQRSRNPKSGFHEQELF